MNSCKSVLLNNRWRVAAGIICAMMTLIVFASCKHDVEPGTIPAPAPTPIITINTQPAPNTSVTQGSITGSLNIRATVTQGASLSYQWYRNTSANSSGGTAISGATSASFTIPASLTAGTYYYFCEVKAAGADTKRSAVATLKVNPQGTPSVPVITINIHPSPDTSVAQGSITGSLSVSAAVTQGSTLSYQWYRNTSANTSGGTAVSGATGASFTIPATLPAGTYYYFCEVRATGADSLRSNLATVIVNYAGSINITRQPASNTDVTQGIISGSLSLEATVTEGTSLSYQWYRNTSADNENGTAMGGETGTSFTIPTTLTTGIYYYFCEVRAQGAASLRSNLATVNVAPPPLITIDLHPAESTSVIQGIITGALNVEASVTPDVALSYQWYIIYTNNPEIGSDDTKTAIDGERNASFTIPADLTGMSYPNTRVYYYACEVSAPGATPVLSNVAEIRVYLPPVPEITRQPVLMNTSVTQGNISGSLSVEAEVGLGLTLYYQWYSSNSESNEGGTPIDGETSASFVIPVNLSAGTHYFFCEVSATGGGKIRSISAPVRVVPIEVDFVVELNFADEPALIEQIAFASANTSKIFTVSGDYTEYQWRVDGAIAGTSSSYTFNYPAETYELFVLVTDIAGRKYSGSCRVTVLP